MSDIITVVSVDISVCVYIYMHSIKLHEAFGWGPSL